jgi:anti-anti-sigma factor
LRGEHEAFTADKLSQEFDRLLEAGVAILVDLRRTTFIDSTVVGLLLTASRAASERGVDFVLLVGDETGWPVHRLLEVTGLGSDLEVVHA